VVRTLQHIENERNEAEQNTDWLDQVAYESRVALLDRLSAWYTDEVQEIDKAIDRVQMNTYGLCRACHNAIEAHRLDLFPEAQFCFDCQDYRERLRTG
jgi:RNA polymerase-binding transcription factor DksA